MFVADLDILQHCFFQIQFRAYKNGVPSIDRKSIDRNWKSIILTSLRDRNSRPILIIIFFFAIICGFRSNCVSSDSRFRSIGVSGDSRLRSIVFDRSTRVLRNEPSDPKKNDRKNVSPFRHGRARNRFDGRARRRFTFFFFFYVVSHYNTVLSAHAVGETETERRTIAERGRDPRKRFRVARCVFFGSRKRRTEAPLFSVSSGSGADAIGAVRLRDELLKRRTAYERDAIPSVYTT